MDLTWRLRVGCKWWKDKEEGTLIQIPHDSMLTRQEDTASLLDTDNLAEQDVVLLGPEKKKQPCMLPRPASTLSLPPPAGIPAAEDPTSLADQERNMQTGTRDVSTRIKPLEYSMSTGT